MPFIPHTDADIKEMLATIGVASIDELFDEIPAALSTADLTNLPEGLSEQAVTRLITERAPVLQAGQCFIGAGAYEHYIPAAIWQITTRGEYYTAYTPYQAEASQGSLQLIYEYQTMMSELTAMPVSNASMYDGATALAEAVLMAVRIKRSKKNQVIVPTTVNPRYRQVLTTILTAQNIQVISIGYDKQSGTIDLDQLSQLAIADVAALVIPQPNFFGCLEPVDELTNWAKQHDMLSIAIVNPTAMALFVPPGEWGNSGVDIACGEGQPLGVPLSYGGPYFGFLCCRQEHLRQLPGRLVGRTVDNAGREGFTLTLQAREQHIRRGKAKSNICTNQGLLVVAATIYMSLLGPHGLRDVAAASWYNTQRLAGELQALNGVEVAFAQPGFHECVIRLPKPVDQVLSAMQQQGIQAGYALTKDYPELVDCLLVCATETKTADDLTRYVNCLCNVLQTLKEHVDADI